jgi:hypothetical protein
MPGAPNLAFGHFHRSLRACDQAGCFSNVAVRRDESRFALYVDLFVVDEEEDAQ